jgi:hypothetical protein
VFPCTVGELLSARARDSPVSPRGNGYIRARIVITGRTRCAHRRWIRRRESGYPVASASLARTMRSASLSVRDSTGTAGDRLCRWADAGVGRSPVGVADYDAQRSEDVYFPGQVQRVLVRGLYPGDRTAWGHGGR